MCSIVHTSAQHPIFDADFKGPVGYGYYTFSFMCLDRNHNAPCGTTWEHLIAVERSDYVTGSISNWKQIPFFAVLFEFIVCLCCFFGENLNPALLHP